LQVKIEEAGKKVPSARQALDGLAQGSAPTLPDREFTPPKSLDDQLGAAKVSTALCVRRQLLLTVSNNRYCCMCVVLF